jgi:signal transduction histidine kinase
VICLDSTATAAEVIEQPVLMTMYALYPDGHLPRSWLRWPSLASLLLAVVGVGAAAVNVDLIPVFFAPSALLALGVLALRWRAAIADERQLLRWLLGVGLGVTGVTIPAVALLPTNGGAAVGLGLTLVELTVVVAATLRHHVYGIDVILRRTLVYGLLTLLVAGVFVGAVGFATLVGVDRTGPSAFTAAAVSVLLLAPARSWLQRRVDRFVYGASGDPYAVVSSLTADFAGASTPHAVIDGYARSMREALRVPWVEVTYGEPPRRAVSGQAAGPASLTPLVHRGRHLGVLAVGLRRGEDSPRRRERKLLTDLAAHAAVVVESVTLARELQDSREQVVAAREEERRRLRMDLHDGLGPHLTGITLGLDVASEKVADPDVAAALESLRGELFDAIGDVRRIVAGLRPPRLDEVGLAGAIAEAVERAARSGLDITFTTPGLAASLPAAIEVALFRIADEAINNAVRHSGASTCQVTLTVEDQAVIRVDDNGSGCVVAVAGTGLESMRYRAEELGGTLSAGPLPGGGWRLEASIPLLDENRAP